MSAWNPIDNWVSSKPTQLEVLERVGPITIDDFLIVSDSNETKDFNIRLVNAGKKTCVAVDYGDSSPVEYYGFYASCRLRNGELVEADVTPFDTVRKEFDVKHVFLKRDLYRMHVYGFDERNYAETFLDLTIFRLPCTSPHVYLPKNQTSFLQWEKIPTVHRSKPFQVPAKAKIECNGTVPT